MQHIIRLRKILVLGWVLGTLLSLLACGQKGPLFLPAPSQPATTGSSSPVATTPTPASTDTSKKP